MRIALITPYGREHRNGNWRTAARWARFLREAGHTVRTQVEWDGRNADLMLALHARRSFGSIRAFAERFPTRPLLLTLTGTDLYRDIHEDRDAQQALELAHRIIVLQERGPDELATHLAEALPGLTGLWQVRGKNRTTFDQMMLLDIDYVRRKSLRLDLYILLQTLPAILRELSTHEAN